MDTSLSNGGNGGLLRSDSHESLPGFASTLVHSPSVENFLTQTQPPAFPHLSHSLSSSTHSLPHTVNSFESVGDRTTEYNSGRELNRFDEEEALFSASPRLKPESPTLEGKLQSVATIEQNDKDFDYDDGEVIINLRARPTSANGQAAVEPAAKSLPETPVKQTATRPISADLMASPQLVSPKVKVVETTVLVEKMAEVALDRKELAEFDPLINFETPLQPQMAVSDANCLSPSLGKNKSVPQTPQPSLLDTISNEFTTPSSFLKYTERDMQAMRSQLEAEVIIHARYYINTLCMA